MSHLNRNLLRNATYFFLHLTVRTFLLWSRNYRKLTELTSRNKLKTRANILMFTVTIFMFVLTSGYWATGIASVISLIQSRLLEPNPHDPGVSLPLFSALALLNVS